jgi:hypothetical protein
VGTTAFGGGGFTVWGCFSLNCKIDLYVIDGTLRGQKYRDQILRSLVVPHCDGHPLASRPILMDGNAIPGISRSPYADVAINWIQQKRLLSDQYTLFHDLIFHPIWSRAHCSRAVLWHIVSSGRFIGLLARNLALLRRLLTVRLLMRPLTIHWLRNVFVVLNGCCLASLLRSLSSLGVIFRDLSVLWRS